MTDGLTNDELKRRLAAAEAALREGDTRSRLLIETWAQAVWETDAAGVVVSDSASWRAYTGQTLEEWLGYGWLDAIHPEDRAFAERQWREAMAARRQVNAEFRLRAPNGGWRWTNVLAAPLLDAAGNIEKWLGLNIDIHARKMAEASLRESEERYRSLFESMDEAYAVVEVLKDENGRWADFRFLEVNRAFLVHTTMPWPVGKTATELLGSPNPRWTELYGHALDTGEPLRVEEPEATLGLIFDLNIFSLDRDRNRVAVLFTNVTGRKQAETALRESEARYRNLFETMRQGYIENELIRDADGRAVDYVTRVVNPQFERLTGISGADALGRTARELVGELDPAWIETYDRVVRSGKPEEFEREEPAFGRWFEVQAYPLTGDRFAILYDDITERRLTDAALRESEERQAFLLTLSDALRPLGDPVEVMATASQLLAEHLGASRVMYSEFEGEGAARVAHTQGQFIREGEPFPETVAYDAFIGGEIGRILRSGGELVVENSAREERFGPEIRDAWLAAGLRSMVAVGLTKKGREVAHFGFHHNAPRGWSSAEVEMVREVAERTWSAIERARAEAALREREADLARVQRIGEVGGLDIDVAHGLRSIRSPEYLRLHGLPQDGREESHADWLARVHPDDREKAERALFEALESDTPSYDSEYRIVRPSDGAVRWIHARADIERDASGKAVRLVGAHIDVTEQKRSTEALRESEARLAAAFESVPVGVAVIDMSGRAVLSNAEYRRFLPGGVIPSRDAQNVAHWRAWDEHGSLLEPQDWPSARALRGETVVPGQEMLFTDDNGDEIWTTVATAPTRDIDGSVTGIVSVVGDIDVTKRAQNALSESEERLSLAIEIGALASWDWDLRSGEVKWNDRHFLMQGYFVGEVPPSFDAWAARVHPDDRAETIALIERARDRRGIYVHEFRSLYPTGEIRWCSARGRFFYDSGGAPCRMIGVMEDITDRKLTEEAIRESEERFQQFANASSGAIWIRNAQTLAMEYVSPAIEHIYGVSQEAFLGDMSRWAAMIVPEDREIALSHIEQARQGEPAVHEFRIQRPSDKAFRWIRNTDFPLYDLQGNIERVGGIAEDITEEKLSVEHQAVLLAELQHRVRNIMAILRSIAARTAQGAETVEDYAALMGDRINTFARVQALLTRAANVGVGLAAIVGDELQALAAHAGQFESKGPDIELSPKAAETMTLAVHELTTNALKYGALSVPEGKVRVLWKVVEIKGRPWLSFDWSELGAPLRPVSDKPRRVGFGSELIEGRIPYELNGRGKVTIDDGGAQCHLEFPLEEGASILETGAPQRAIVFGGAIDMTGQADLTGQCILVVEDDYYLASDTARALQGAGANVLGPCATEDAARAEIRDTLPTAAVLDINLRNGRSFDLAGDFMRNGVPFVFITGYDEDIIPERFKGITRLQKPVEFRHVLGALAEALGI